MTECSTVRVLLADDHPVVRFGISAIVGSEPNMVVIGCATTGLEAVQMCREHRPDVILMDLRMPELSGIEAICMIRKEQPNSKFIVLTTYQGDEDIYKALAAGAQGYLLKGMSHLELLEAIRRVHAGRQYLPESVQNALANRPPASDLTTRELQILKLIVKGRSNKEIAHALGITEGTVKWHINVLLGRMGVDDRTQAAVTALQRGIIEI